MLALINSGMSRSFTGTEAGVMAWRFCPQVQGINPLHAGDGVRVEIIPLGVNLGENFLDRMGLDS